MGLEMRERIEMIYRGELPEGYKKTKVGVIPTDWKVEVLAKYVDDIKSGLSRKLSHSDIGLPVLRSNNLNNNKVSFEDIKYWYVNDPQGSNTANYLLKNGDILINFINSISQIGKVAIYEDNIGRDVIFTTNILKMTLNKNFDSVYFLYYSQTSKYQDYVMSITKPAVNQASFTTVDYKNMKLPMPPINEQQKIATILSTWDKAIELKEKLIVQKKEQGKGLTQVLMSGKGRLPSFFGEIKRRELKGLIKEVSLKNRQNEVKTILSVTNSRGFIEQSEQFARQVASSDISTYKIVKRGQFAYNPSRVNVGSIDQLSSFDMGVLSPIYVVFKTDENKLTSKYLYHFIKSNDFLNQMKSLLQGSVRQNLNFDSLELMKLFIPEDINEQKAISALLDTSSKEIELFEQELDLLKQQKKGLMQLLLTGIVRVKS